MIHYVYIHNMYVYYYVRTWYFEWTLLQLIFLSTQYTITTITVVITIINIIIMIDKIIIISIVVLFE